MVKKGERQPLHLGQQKKSLHHRIKVRVRFRLGILNRVLLSYKKEKMKSFLGLRTVGISEDGFLNARHKYIRRLESGHLAITISIKSGLGSRTF